MSSVDGDKVIGTPSMRFDGVDHVEDQMQNGSAHSIEWAPNEEYYYNDDGHLNNSSYLDYRTPTNLDLPMIETIIIEIPNLPVIPIACVASAKPISRHCSRRWPPYARKNHR